MGLSCLFHLRETRDKKKFIAPTWANHYTKDDFPHRMKLDNPTSWLNSGFWWIELGGVNNSIEDTELLQEELQKIVYGIWDFIKNSGYCNADNWDLDWVCSLAGKRESRRYLGDHVLTQNDMRAEGRFDDLVAYGGWSMDDHHPMGIKTAEEPTVYHKAPSPYGIPYRSLYSININNLMFAGRNISATHTAMSSSRVMSTCAVLGQAMGTAAAIAVKNNFLPRDVYTYKIIELQNTLMDDDCYLPFHERKIPVIMKKAEIVADSGDTSLLINGIERKIGNVDNQWIGNLNSDITIQFDAPVSLSELHIVFDSDINRDTYIKDMDQQREFPVIGHKYLNQKDCYVPHTLIKEFSVLANTGDGEFKEIYSTENNYQRLFKLKLDGKYSKLKVIPKETWGSDEARVYSLDVK